MIEFLVQNKEWLFSGVGVSIVAVLFVLVRRVLRRIKERPSLDKVEISLAIGAPNTRTCSGSFVLSNPSGAPRSLTDIVPRSSVHLPPVKWVSLKGRPDPDHGKEGSLLPVQIPPGSHRVYFRTEQVANIHTGPLPDEVKLRVMVDRRPLPYRILKKDNTNHYS